MDVKIFDNFLSPSDLITIEKYGREEELPWRGEFSDMSNPYNLSFFSHDIYTGDIENSRPLAVKNDYFSVTIFDKIQKKIGRHFLKRIYFNGQYSSMDGSFHMDADKEDVYNKTVIIYLGPYHREWGGFTQFYESDKDQMIVAPIPGRMVVFDGRIPHKGYSFSRQACPMRINLVYKINR